MRGQLAATQPQRRRENSGKKTKNIKKERKITNGTERRGTEGDDEDEGLIYYLPVLESN